MFINSFQIRHDTVCRFTSVASIIFTVQNLDFILLVITME